MPEMGGYEATKLIRQRELKLGLPHLPIFGLSANAMTGDREHAIEVGMDDYLTKPLKSEALRGALSELGHSGRLESATDNPNVETPVLNSSFHKEYDVDGLLDRCGGDVELVKELLDMFMVDWPKMVNAMDNAIKESDSVQLARAAHSAKGAAAIYTQGDVYDLAKEIELLGKEGDLAAAALLYKQFVLSSEDLVATLRRVLESLN